MEPAKAKEILASTRCIEGWLAFEAGMLFAWIDDIQRKTCINGDLFEIGVHHGKSAVLFGSFAIPGLQKLGVCDIFENQGENLSRSGCGDRQVFEANLQKYIPPGVEVTIFSKSSLLLTPQEIGMRYRFFHIDGGHDVSEALNDLRLAAETTLAEGVIVIDDPFNAEWPGVTEAILEFLLERKEFCAPIAGFNKMLLVRRQFADLYAGEIDQTSEHSRRCIHFPWYMKTAVFMDYPMRIFYIPAAIKTKLYFPLLKSRRLDFLREIPWLRGSSWQAALSKLRSRTP